MLKPSVCFEVQKIIGISTGEGNCKTYQIQWAPLWISGVHLLGCEGLIEQFESEQEEKEKETDIKVELIEFVNDHEGNSEPCLSLGEINDVRLPAEPVKQEIVENTCNNNVSTNEVDSQFDFTTMLVERENTTTTDAIQCIENISMSLNSNLSSHRITSNFTSASTDIFCSDITPRNTDNLEIVDSPFSEDIEDCDREYTTRYVGTSIETHEYVNVAEDTFNITLNMPPKRTGASSSSREVENNKLYKENNSDSANNKYKHKYKHIKGHPCDENFCCSICGRTFNYKCDLKRHLVVHDKGECFPCSVCKMIFSDNTKLQDHLEMHRIGCKYQCSICQKNVSTNSGLQRHIRVHTGERPFECKICQKGFQQKATLQRHVASVHKEIP